jgi:hypothetical protein
VTTPLTPDDGPFEALAKTFMTPAKSGVYLTRNELVVLARLSEASLRINERPRMLVDIFRSAQTADDLVAIVQRLRDFTVANLEAYEALATEYPSTARLWRPWVDKARRTLVLLDDVAHDIRL